VGERPTICQLLHTMHVGGAEVLAARLARQLGDRFRFLFACLEDAGTLGDELRAEGFAVEVLGRRPGLDWRCGLKLARLLRRERVDLVHAHQYTPFFYGIAARLLTRRPPVLFTEHGRHFPDYPRRKRMIVNRLLIEGRDRIVGVGEAVRQALIHNEGISASRVGVIYNGIDVDRFPARGDQEAIRRELGLAATDLVVLQVARLDYLKDHATAVRTIQRVAARRPDARLVLVGDGPEREAISGLVNQLGLSEHVLFLGLRSDIPRLLRAADLLLLTSISEGIPLTLIEGMAAGLPVVSTDVGGTSEVVVAEETGLLAPAKDDDALARAVLRLGEDAALRRHLGQRGQERARALFSEARMHGHYLDLYREMLARQSAGSKTGAWPLLLSA
jgi:glycosyltransferase involved in cell wall biosynthesis